MKPAVLLFLFCTACATREVVRIEKVPVIEKQIYLIPAIPIQPQVEEEAPAKPPMTA